MYLIYICITVYDIILCYIIPYYFKLCLRIRYTLYTLYIKHYVEHMIFNMHNQSRQVRGGLGRPRPEHQRQLRDEEEPSPRRWHSTLQLSPMATSLPDARRAAATAHDPWCATPLALPGGDGLYVNAWPRRSWGVSNAPNLAEPMGPSGWASGTSGDVFEKVVL